MSPPRGFLFEPEPDGATPLNPDDAEGLKPTWIATREELNQAEMANITQAVIWAYVGRRPVATVEDLLTISFSDLLHKKMFADVWTWAGTHRRSQTNIGVEPYLIVPQMKLALDDALFWHDRQTYPPTEIAVRLHHRLVVVHPYPNGNGRHTRMMADLYLYVVGLQRLSWGGESLVGHSAARRKYIAAVVAANGHDIAPLLEFATS
jgi:Fic-DOC domain mobile mystery protein B